MSKPPSPLRDAGLQRQRMQLAAHFGLERVIDDLVLLDANPLDSISNTRKIRSVVINGRYLSRSDLDGLLHTVQLEAANAK